MDRRNDPEVVQPMDSTAGPCATLRYGAEQPFDWSACLTPIDDCADPLMETARTMKPSRLLTASALCVCDVVVAASSAHGQSGGSVHPTPPPVVRAALRSAPIALDGRLDEPVWAEAQPATGFTQSQPREGERATQRTDVRFLFDDDAIWIGARMFDDLGAAGVRTRLVRRDREADGDLLSVTLDTHHDHVQGAQFSINPSGVKGDAYGRYGDPSWDPVWEAATATDSLGWTAELRIPLSQLRFPRDSAQTWGLQVVRLASRINERSHWAFWRLNESGGPARYGHLEGLRFATQPRHAEVLPYAVASSSYLRADDAADPFYERGEDSYRFGADLKYGLTSNLTLDATINPDFGQVEVDPAVVNLSAFETFFEEKRPFFIAGADHFGFGGFNCFFCSNVQSIDLFYSRRIGRFPQGAGLAEAAGDYANVPANTTILGAAKLTGRTSSGWSIGIMDAVTRREYAPIAMKSGQRFEREVEPASNYFVGRFRRDLRGGAMTVGGIVTSVHRDLRDSALADQLTRHAEAGGIDADIWWGERTYRLMVQAAVSQIAGESAAVLRAQESSARYFQRPDRAEGSNGWFARAYDPTATELRGYALHTRLAKESGDWLWEASTQIRSPGFEVNDIAFLSRADYAWMAGNVFRQFTTPTKYYRNLYLIAGAQQQFNYDGNLTDRQFHGYLGTQFLNYWGINTFVIQRASTLKGDVTRGGPLVRGPSTRFYQLNAYTDSRKPLVISGGGSVNTTEEGRTSNSVFLDALYRPMPNVSIQVSPSWSRSESAAQYVTTTADAAAVAFFGKRYVFADLLQQTLSMNTRVNVTFNPTLSLEVFAQPLISSVDYASYKEFAAPRRLQKNVYGVDLGTIRVEGAGDERQYVVDPDGAGTAAEFRFDDPDFNFRSIRGNALLRWEYRPGSTLYLVWTQSRSTSAPVGDLDFGRDREALFGAKPENVFLIKLSYWLGL